MSRDSMENNNEYFDGLCMNVKNLINEGRLEETYNIIREELCKSPHSPVPHNLMGILLEIKREHALAMKHFRIAWVLDATYLPALHNLEHFGTFYSKGHSAYTEKDCVDDTEKKKNKNRCEE